MSTILEVVEANKNFVTMANGFKAAGLETDLKKNGPFTVFAPIEIAFGKLHEGELYGWMKPENKQKLIDILSCHVVEGKTNFKDFIDGQKLKTLNGHELTVKVSGNNVRINGAKILGRDSEASNGVVHSLDTIVMPLN